LQKLSKGDLSFDAKYFPGDHDGIRLRLEREIKIQTL